MIMFLHTPFNVLLSKFSSFPLYLSTNTVAVHAFEALERTLRAEDPKTKLPQSKEEGGIVEASASSDKDKLRQFLEDPEL